MISILSYDSAGTMKVSVRRDAGTAYVYTYFDVSPYWKRKFQYWIKQGWFGLAFKKLKHFADRERFEGLGGEPKPKRSPERCSSPSIY